MADKGRNYIKLGALMEGQDDDGGSRHWISFCTQLQEKADGSVELKKIEGEKGVYQVDGIILRDSRDDKYFYVKNASISDRYVSEKEAEAGVLGHIIVKKGGKALVEVGE